METHDNTAPAREALTAWDKLFNERESLNGNLDCSKDAAYHQPEGKVPAETVRELATAAILLEQTNTLLDKVNERQSRRPSNALDEADEIREEIADTILAKARRHGFTVQHSDGEFPFQLVGPKVTVEGLAEQIAGLGKIGTEKEPISDAEEKPERFAIPEMLGERRADQDIWVHDVYMAAQDHAKHLSKAEGRIMKAKGLAETLRCALLSQSYDPEPFADDVVADIIDHLSKAQERIDRHSQRHSNLFLAYFDKEQPEPRDLSNPNQREHEKRDIVRRLLQLSRQDTSDVTMCHIMLAQMEDQSEGLRLLDKYPLTYVYRFLSVQKDEAERENAADEGGAPCGTD